jgi:hypothetical protein
MEREREARERDRAVHLRRDTEGVREEVESGPRVPVHAPFARIS